MRKEQFLSHWSQLPADQPIRPKPIEYKRKGSTYAEDGIRITGSREFIDAVLSRLKDLLEYESIETRLQVVYQESKSRISGQPMGTYNCYIQVHRRGREGAILQAYMAGCRD